MGLLSIVPLPYRLLAMAIAALALIAFGWVKGNQHGTLKLTEYQAAQAMATAKVIVKQGAVTERVVTEYVKTAGKTEVVTKNVEKEVVRYAEKNPGACLDAGWRVLHDRAAANALPSSPGGTDGPLPAPRSLTGGPGGPGSRPGDPDGHLQLRAASQLRGPG